MENDENEVVVPQDDQEVQFEESEQVAAPTFDKDADARRQLTARAKAAEAEAKRLKEELKRSSLSKAPLAVEDYIDISTSLDGLDQREKAYLAEQHRLSGKPLKDIRENEDFKFWQESYRARQEKENALKPNATQAFEEGPKSITQKLRSATVAEKEQILKDAGLYREYRSRGDRTSIGLNRK